MDHLLVQPAKMDQQTTSVPPRITMGALSPQKSKKGSQASVSPCCAKMYQKMVQKTTSGPEPPTLVDQKNNKCAPKNNNGSPQKSKKGFWSKWARTPIVCAPQRITMGALKRVKKAFGPSGPEPPSSILLVRHCSSKVAR